MNKSKVSELPQSELSRELRDYFPQLSPEDIAQFEAHLHERNIAEERNGYRLNFVGREYARLQTGLVSDMLISPDTEHNTQPENAQSGNIFITGDNLEALRHLQNAYASKVKMIYIDPPYNTGKEFVYFDKFEYSDEKLKIALGYSDEEIARLKSIQGKSSHSAWLTFMCPRLALSKKLLADDGVIFVSIDDNEQANLKLLMDDVFGEGNFITQFLWNKTATPPSLSNNVRKKYEYMLCYQKTNHRDYGLSAGEVEGGDMPLLNEANTERDLIFDKDAVNFKINGIFEKGVYDRIELLENIEIENGKSDTDLKLRGKFKWVQSTVSEEIKNGTVFWVKSDKFAIRYERNEARTKTPSNIINKIECGVGTNEDASKELKELFDNSVDFDFPKPTSLIKYLLNMVPDKDALILDFFAGSGTTAHAVMQLNAEDGGNRRWMMVQLDEPTNPDSEARKAGYETIDQISRERIRRAGEKIKAQQLPNLFAGDNAALDTGFKHYRLIAPQIQTLDKIETFDPNLGGFEDMITPMGGRETILSTWLIDDGYPFDTPVEDIVFEGYLAHYVATSQTLYLIDRGLTTQALKAILNRIGRGDLIVSTIVAYPYSFEFERMRELEIGVKMVDDLKLNKRY